MIIYKNEPVNISVPMTRRYPPLRDKQKVRDNKVAKKMLQAWDVEQSEEKTFQVFLKDNSELSDPRYWELLKTTWIIAGNHKTIPTFIKWFKSPRGYKSYFMTPEEKQHLDSLPDKITVWRACNEGDTGISWTTNPAYAEKFKAMFGKETVIERIVSKTEIFAYLNRNKEDEILILP